MTSERSSRLIWPHPAFARVLSFLLLALIVYGTTVEAAHRHQRVLSSADSGTTSILADNEDVENALGLGCSDCLICQLQQNFSSTVITHRQFDPPATETVQISVQVPTVFSSLTSAPRTGRAPPVAS